MKLSFCPPQIPQSLLVFLGDEEGIKIGSQDLLLCAIWTNQCIGTSKSALSSVIFLAWLFYGKISKSSHIQDLPFRIRSWGLYFFSGNLPFWLYGYPLLGYACTWRGMLMFPGVHSCCIKQAHASQDTPCFSVARTITLYLPLKGLLPKVRAMHNLGSKAMVSKGCHQVIRWLCLWPITVRYSGSFSSLKFKGKGSIERDVRDTSKLNSEACNEDKRSLDVSKTIKGFLSICIFESFKHNWDFSYVLIGD